MDAGGRTIFAGTIDEVAIYSASLSSAQVALHYSAGNSVASSAYSQSVLSDTPSAFYQVDDVNTALSDVSTNHVSGSYGAGVVRRSQAVLSSSTDPVAFFPGGAWVASAIAAVPANSLLQPANVSVEAWVRPSSVPSHK